MWHWLTLDLEHHENMDQDLDLEPECEQTLELGLELTLEHQQVGLAGQVTGREAKQQLVSTLLAPACTLLAGQGTDQDAGWQLAGPEVAANRAGLVTG